MSYVKPLAMAAALALSLTGMEALAATHTADIPTQSNTQQQARHKLGPGTYYIADAGTPNAHKVYYFKKLDRNHDGQLFRSEIPKTMWRLRLHFIAADLNRNGRLSPAEYMMWKHHTAPEYVGIFRAYTVVFSRLDR